MYKTERLQKIPFVGKDKKEVVFKQGDGSERSTDNKVGKIHYMEVFPPKDQSMILQLEFESDKLVYHNGTRSVFDPYSGEIVYMENRAKVLRDAAQQEDIKVIITV